MCWCKQCQQWGGPKEVTSYTPGKGKIVPCNIIIINSFQWQEWRTKIPTSPSWSLSCTVPTVQFWCWNSPWWWRYGLAVDAIARALSPTSGGSTHTKILTTRSWSLLFTDSYMPKLTVLTKLWALYKFLFFSLGRHCWLSWIDRRARVRVDDRAWSSRGMCINWNALQYIACATVELQPVTTRLPRVRLPLELL